MNSRSVLHKLARAFKAPVSRLQHPSTLRLSWNSTWCVCPASDKSPARLLPVTVADDLRPAVYQTTSLGPPSWFLTTSTVSSARSIRVYCNPSRTRFATFQVPWSRPFQMHAVRRISLHTSETAGPATPFYRSPAHPRNAVHTLRRIPLASSRTASLRPLPSCCSAARYTTPTPGWVCLCCPDRSRCRDLCGIFRTVAGPTAEAAGPRSEERWRSSSTLGVLPTRSDRRRSVTDQERGLKRALNPAC